MSICGNNSVHGERSRFIKFHNGNIIAVEGSNILETLNISDLRIPYKQIMKSRIILKRGQTDYLLNHLGLGDNVTFLAIKATYNTRSKREEDNFVKWRFFDNGLYEKSFKEIMLLTGNSENRIKQIYLTNPNSKWEVQLDVMVAVIDDEFSFFTDRSQQTGITILNMSWDRIKTFKVGESFQIVDDKDDSMLYVKLSNIKLIERSGKLVIIEDVNLGGIYLDHSNEKSAAQTLSLITLLLNDLTIDTKDVVIDDTPPVITFYNNWYDNPSNDFIISQIFGTQSLPSNTTMGITYSTNINLNNGITKEDIIDGIIDTIVDDRDGPISINTDDISIHKDNSTFNNITSTGSYILRFNVSDIALNNLNDIKFILKVI